MTVDVIRPLLPEFAANAIASAQNLIRDIRNMDILPEDRSMLGVVLDTLKYLYDASKRKLSAHSWMSIISMVIQLIVVLLVFYGIKQVVPPTWLPQLISSITDNRFIDGVVLAMSHLSSTMKPLLDYGATLRPIVSLVLRFFYSTLTFLTDNFLRLLRLGNVSLALIGAVKSLGRSTIERGSRFVNMLLRRIPTGEKENPAVADGYREIEEAVADRVNRKVVQSTQVLSDVVGLGASAAAVSPWIGSVLSGSAMAMISPGDPVTAVTTLIFGQFMIYMSISVWNLVYYMTCYRSKCSSLKSEYVACRRVCWEQGAVGLSAVSEVPASVLKTTGLLPVHRKYLESMQFAHSLYKESTAGAVITDSTPMYETIKWYRDKANWVKMAGVAVVNPHGAKRAKDNLGVRRANPKTRDPSRRRRGLNALHFGRRLRPLDST